MASLLRARAARPEWSVEDCAVFAARKEFELLKLLALDPKTFRTARRLGYARGQQPKPQAGKVRPVSESSSARSSNTSVHLNNTARTRPTKPSKRERELRRAAATKLQALGVGFLTRRKELPAAREFAFRRSRAEAATVTAGIREEILDAQDAAAILQVRDGKRRVSFAAAGSASKRSSSPASSASSLHSACEEAEVPSS